MAKLRQNIVTGKWVVIAPERAKRPEDFVMASAPKRHMDGECPFCLTNPKSAYQFSIKDAETDNIYVIPNKYPAFNSADEEVINESDDFYFSTKSVGGHEVIIFKDHETEVYEGGWEPLTELFGVYKERYLFWKKDAAIEYAMPIHNLGPEAAASIEHPHSQFFASSIIPNLIEDELVGSKKFFQDKGKCVFCAMIEEEKKQNCRIVSENEDFVAFTFFASRFPFEIWVLPKKHSSFFEQISQGELDNMGRVVYDCLSKLNASLKSPPLNWWVHTSPVKKDHLDDYYHWHLEIAPRVSKFGGYEMGSGIVIDVVSPELAAQFLKKV
ncbi:MAG: DUF4921 family protein [Patescibacteria group bacterium]|nr:DUF4921 family protein [Patescibacteria group bacterium]